MLINALNRYTYNINYFDYKIIRFLLKQKQLFTVKKN